MWLGNVGSHEALVCASNGFVFLITPDRVRTVREYVQPRLALGLAGYVWPQELRNTGTGLCVFRQGSLTPGDDRGTWWACGGDLRECRSLPLDWSAGGSGPHPTSDGKLLHLSPWIHGPAEPAEATLRRFDVDGKVLRELPLGNVAVLLQSCRGLRFQFRSEE